MNNFNVVKARYFYIVDGEICPKGKKYTWHIPKRLREADIKKGDLILVRAASGRKAKVIVVDVFREEIKTGEKIYKDLLLKIETESKVPTVELNK